MAAKRDYYEILGVDKKAEAAAIKRAYRGLAKRYHPDINGSDSSAEETLKEINEAYEVLSDEKKRALYDRYGFMAFEPGFSEEAAERQRQQAKSAYDRGGDFGFHFETGTGADFFDDIFGDLFGAGAGYQNAYGADPYGSYSAKGSDVEAEITIGFEEAILGCDKQFSLRNGETGAEQKLQVHIPAGVDTGSRIRMKGQGGAGAAGSENGDLYLKVVVADKPGYERKGQDLYTTLNIPYTTAVFGGKVRVHTLYGDVMCKIKAGTQSGSKIRLKGKGVVSMKDKSRYGDLYLIVQIEVPRNLAPEASRKLREFQKASGY